MAVMGRLLQAGFGRAKIQIMHLFTHAGFGFRLEDLRTAVQNPDRVTGTMPRLYSFAGGLWKERIDFRCVNVGRL